MLLPGNRVEDAKGVDLSGGPADAVVGKLETNGFLELELGRHRTVVDAQVAKLYDQRPFGPIDWTPGCALLQHSSRSVTLPVGVRGAKKQPSVSLQPSIVVTSRTVFIQPQGDQPLG